MTEVYKAMQVRRIGLRIKIRRGHDGIG
jgi:hypothetical protein